ncbi:MAG: response regulator transcription factor [Lachnospiraceae bacterium]|nr:response regulator transcription factor [Lachnospiraceae bacterium]
MAERILIVDDEKAIVKGLRYSIEQDGMETDEAYDGEEALALARSNHYDLVLLDLMLPKIDGMEVCRQIREFSDVPIIFLTAKDTDMDKIMGFESGADDYITKPFNILEVKARIRVFVRRSRKKESPAAVKSSVIENGEFRFDIENRRLFIRGEEINLTSKEFDILELLVTHPGKVYSRENLKELVWGKEYSGDARTVDVHVRRLREKIEETPGAPKYVQTKWGVGYFYKG